MRIHAFIPVKDRDVSVIVGIGQADAQHPYEIWRLQALLVTAWAALFVIACSALLLQHQRLQPVRLQGPWQQQQRRPLRAAAAAQ